MEHVGVYLSEGGSRARLIGRYGTERAARRAAAKALWVDTLRGLAQAPTEEGVRYYAPGADDDTGAAVELRWE